MRLMNLAAGFLCVPGLVCLEVRVRKAVLWSWLVGWSVGGRVGRSAGQSSLFLAQRSWAALAGVGSELLDEHGPRQQRGHRRSRVTRGARGAVGGVASEADVLGRREDVVGIVVVIRSCRFLLLTSC